MTEDVLLPLPDEFNIPTGLYPFTKIVVENSESTTIRVELFDSYTPPSFLDPRTWSKRLENTNTALKARSTFTDFMEAYNYAMKEAESLPYYDINELRAANLDSLDILGELIISSKAGQVALSHDMHMRNDALLQHEWNYFINTYEDYLGNPKDFYLAYEVVNSHPMFWRLEGDIENSKTLVWDTCVAFEHLHHTVFGRGRSASVSHQIEGGPASCMPVEGTRSGSSSASVPCIPRRIASLDLNLTSEAATYELAVVDFAQKVTSLYSLSDATQWLSGDCTHR